MTLEARFAGMESVDPSDAKGASSAKSDTPPGYNSRMVSPFPGATGAIAERQIYRGAGVPVWRFSAPPPLLFSNNSSTSSSSKSNTSSGSGTDTSNAWLLGGNATGIVQTLGSLDINDVSGIAGGTEQWRALANGGFQVTNYFAFGGSSVQPTPPGRDTFGYVFSNFNKTLLNPVNEVRIAQNTIFVTRDSSDTNEYAILSVALPAQTSGGHVSVTNGSAAVLWISGTKFDTNWAAGTAITINSVVYYISSVTDTTHLTLTTVYAGTTNANRVYDFTALVVDRSDRFTNGMVVQIGSENMTVNGTPTLSSLVNVTRSGGTAHPANAGVFYVSGGTIVAQGLGWDIRPVNTAVVFESIGTADDPTYRGQGSGFVSELYYEAPNPDVATLNFSLAQFNFAAALAELDPADRLWQWFGYTVGQPIVSAGSKVSQPYGIFVQNLQSGELASDGLSDVIDDLVVAGVKLEALGTFGRIQWNGVDLREQTFNAFTFNGSPTEAFLTQSVSDSDTNWVINLGASATAANYQVNDYLLCEGEIVLINAVTAITSTLTVNRGMRGTTPYPHYGGVSPAVQGRTIQNLSTFQFGRWDGSRNGTNPVTNFYIGAADGISSGAGIRLSHRPSLGGSQIVFDYAASDYQNFRLDARAVSINSIASSVGTVDTSGTAVVRDTGAFFDTAWPSGTTITINSVDYVISSVNSTTSITLTATAGTQTGVAYSVAANSIGLVGSASSSFRVRIGQSDLAHAPLGLISGSLTTTPIGGALEYNGSNWWITDGTNTRYAILTSASAVTSLNGLVGDIYETYDDTIVGSDTGFSTATASGTVNTNGTINVSYNSGTHFDPTWVGGIITIAGVAYVVATYVSNISITTTASVPTAIGAAYTVKTITLHIADAGAGRRGLVSTGAQTFAGDKSWNGFLSSGSYINTSVGYRVGGAAASGYYLRGNGTDFLASQIQAGDISGIAVTSLQGLTGGVTLTFDNTVTSATGFSLTTPSGTIGTTNGSTAVTGSGFSTTWTSGSPILIDGVQYFISSVTNATNLVLTSNYLGTTGSHPYTMSVDTLHIGDASVSQRGLVNISSQSFYGDKTFTGNTTASSGTGALTVDSVVFVSGNLYDGHTPGTADLFTPLYINAQYTNATTGGGTNETAGIRCVMSRSQTSSSGSPAANAFAVIGGEFNAVLLDTSTKGISLDQIIGLRAEIYLGGDSTGAGNSLQGTNTNEQVFGIISTWGSGSFGTVFGPNVRVYSWWGAFIGAPPNGGSNGQITHSAYGLEIESIAPLGGASCAAIVLDGANNAGRILWAGGGYLSEDGAGTITNNGKLTVTDDLRFNNNFKRAGTVMIDSSGNVKNAISYQIGTTTVIDNSLNGFFAAGTFSGNVGIGTSPSVALHVSAAGSSTGILRLNSTNATGARMDFYGNIGLAAQIAGGSSGGLLNLTTVGGGLVSIQDSSNIVLLSTPSGASATLNNDASFTYSGVAFASLPAATNGSLIYCTNAKSVADGVTAGSVATSGGNGCLLQRANGAWLVM
jgi:hypothetical protein